MAENNYGFDNYKMQEIFYEFYTSGKTGVIKVFFSQNIVKTVYFSEGNIVFATSNSEKDKLTNILIKNKKITREQLNMALKQMDKSISLGRNLVNMGLITHKELVWAVKIQVLSIVYSILMLKEGEYSVIEGFLPEGIIKLPFNTLKILFDSLILFKDKEWISQHIKGEMVFQKAPYFDEYIQKIQMDSNFKKIIDLIDGEKSVEAICGMVDIEDFKIYKLFYALSFLKLIEEKSEEADLEIAVEEDIYEVKGDDEENIEMVEELIGEEEKENVDIEFEGTSSEPSVFEEESGEKKQALEIEDEEYESIVLDESDYGEGVPEEAKETVSSDRVDSLEELQRKLEEESPVELKEEISEDEQTMPLSSPYETAKQPMPNLHQGLKEGDNEEHPSESSFVVEETYVEPAKTNFGLYVVLIVVLFIVAIGFLGYNYYQESLKSGKKYQLPSKKTVIVQKSKDITSEDITPQKIKNIDNKLNSQKEIKKEEKETPQITESKDTKKEEKANQQLKETINAEISYEAEPVYTDNGEQTENTQNAKKAEQKNSKAENQIANEKIDTGIYQKYVSNTRDLLLSNPESYTIQLELACQQETLDKAIKLLPDKEKIFFIPSKFKGKTCFIVCYGLFDTQDEAKVAMKTLDSDFFNDNQPIVRQGSKFKKYFK